MSSIEIARKKFDNINYRSVDFINSKLIKTEKNNNLSNKLQSNAKNLNLDKIKKNLATLDKSNFQLRNLESKMKMSSSLKNLNNPIRIKRPSSNGKKSNNVGSSLGNSISKHNLISTPEFKTKDIKKNKEHDRPDIPRLKLLPSIENKLKVKQKINNNPKVNLSIDDSPEYKKNKFNLNKKKNENVEILTTENNNNHLMNSYEKAKCITTENDKPNFNESKVKNFEFTFNSSILKDEFRKLKKINNLSEINSSYNYDNSKISNLEQTNHENLTNKMNLKLNKSNIKFKMVNLNNIQKIDLKVKNNSSKVCNTEQVTYENDKIDNKIDEKSSAMIEQLKMDSTTYTTGSKKLLSLAENYFPEQHLEIIGKPKSFDKGTMNIMNPVINFYRNENILNENADILDVRFKKGNSNNKIFLPPKINLIYDNRRESENSLNKYISISPISSKKINEYCFIDNSIMSEVSNHHDNKNMNESSIHNSKRSTPKIMKNHPQLKKFYEGE